MSEISPILFTCPQCRGPHFNVATDGQMICTSHYHGADGCGWKGRMPDSLPEPIHNHPLHLLVGKIPDFDQGWTPEQKLAWFDGMARLLQAAS